VDSGSILNLLGSISPQPCPSKTIEGLPARTRDFGMDERPKADNL
jgi:hypothetical protein